MKSRYEIAAKARQILQETAAQCPQYAAKLNGVAVEVSGRMTACAGRASYRKNLIKLSLPFYADDTNFEQDLRNTVTHEAAHLVVGPSRTPHGLLWKLTHRSMGGTGERCHELELADGFAARRQQNRLEAPCSKCGKGIKLGPTQYKRHMENVSRGGRGYIHRICP